MNKFSITSFAIASLLLANVCSAASHSLYGYRMTKDGDTIIDTKDDFQSVSSPKKNGWRDYIVTLNVKRSYKDDGGSIKYWVDKINVHFTSEKSAKTFTKVMSGDKSTDLYYNFSDNRYNSTGKSSACNPLGWFCRDFPVTIINFRDVDADEVFALDRGTHKSMPLIDYLDHAESGKLALREEAGEEDLTVAQETNDSGRGISPKHDHTENNCKSKQGKAGAAGIKA